ncbi:MAG: hypothetical protein HY774_08160 [Acidobacteria bacterium]|nr:hypothetical protein [Acidobacteriota bacterium]
MSPLSHATTCRGQLSLCLAKGSSDKSLSNKAATSCSTHKNIHLRNYSFGKVKLNYMLVQNLSSRHISRGVWTSLATSLRLNGILPGGLIDEIGMYRNHQQLFVKVYKEVHHPPGVTVTNGTYSYGEITLHPCFHCTFGFLTFTLLHELIHAWVHQFHPHLYDGWDSCQIGDEFAEEGYKQLGGIYPSKEICTRYNLSISKARVHLKHFDEWVQRVTSNGIQSTKTASNKRVLTWNSLK